jgi:hypothetical protein
MHSRIHDLSRAFTMQDVIGEDPEDPDPSSVMTIKSKINIYGIHFPLYAMEGTSTSSNIILRVGYEELNR